MIEEAIKSGLDLVTTEKDFCRIKDYNFENLKYLKVDLKIKEKNNFIAEVLKYL